MFQKLLQAIRQAIAKLSPPGRTTAVPDESDPLADKLHDLKWTPDEDDEAVGRTLAEAEAKGRGNLDSLAATVYKGRPQNPFSDDF